MVYWNRLKECIPHILLGPFLSTLPRMVLSCHFKFFKGCLPQISFGPLMNNLPQIPVKTLKILVKLVFLSKGSSINFASNIKRILFPLKLSENHFHYHRPTSIHSLDHNLLLLSSEIILVSPSPIYVKVWDR